MTLLIALPGREEDASLLAAHLGEIDQSLEVRIWPDVGEPQGVEMVVAWNQPPGLLASFPNLRLVASFGAGVEHLIRDPEIPDGVSIVRTVDPGLAFGMAEYVVSAVAEWRRGWRRYRADQETASWISLPYEFNSNVVLLGMGRMGSAVAQGLRSIGCRVAGWTSSEREVDGVRCVSGRRSLNGLLPDTDIVVCLLPLTTETDGILDCQFFASMKRGSLLINVGRGDHLVEDDLIAALAVGRPAHAVLDVFRREPLPPEHPFWNHPAITVTPHIAALTNPKGASTRIVENWRRLQAGETLLDPVDREKEY